MLGPYDGQVSSPRSPRLLVIEHESDSGPALLAERATGLGFALDIVTPESAIPVSSAGYAAVISMGSAWGVHDDHLPDGWFADEQSLGALATAGVR